MSQMTTQVIKIDDKTTIVLPCHISSTLLNEADWRPQQGAFGEYQSIRAEGEYATLIPAIQQYGNEKHYVFDLYQNWRYQLNASKTGTYFLNRYTKNTEQAKRTAVILAELKFEKPEQEEPAVEISAQVREAEREEKTTTIPTVNTQKDWIQGHEENMQSQKATRESIDDLSGEIHLFRGEVAELIKTLKSVSSALQRLEKAEGLQDE